MRAGTTRPPRPNRQPRGGYDLAAHAAARNPAQLDTSTPAQRAIYLAYCGVVAVQRREWEAARRLLDEALRTARSCGEGRATAISLLELGILETRLDRLDEAERHLVELLAQARAMENADLEIRAEFQLGRLAAARDDYVAARARYTTALHLAEREGVIQGQAMILNELAYVAMVGDDHPEEARTHLTRAISLKRQLSDGRDLANSLNNLGRVCARLGHSSEAEAAFSEAAEIRARLGLPA